MRRIDLFVGVLMIVVSLALAVGYVNFLQSALPSLDGVKWYMAAWVYSPALLLLLCAVGAAWEIRDGLARNRRMASRY